MIDGRFWRKPRWSAFSCLHKSRTFYRDGLTPCFLCARLELFGYISTCSLPSTCRPQTPYVKDVRIILLIIPHASTNASGEWDTERDGLDVQRNTCYAQRRPSSNASIYGQMRSTFPEARRLSSVYCQFLNVMGLEMTLGSLWSQEGSVVCHAVFL